MNCKVDPCEVSSCDGVSDAMCVADYCGGCNARWYKNDIEVTNSCEGMCSVLCMYVLFIDV